MAKKYCFKTLAMLGQMYDESGEEEVNFPSGTLFYLAIESVPASAFEDNARIEVNGKRFVLTELGPAD